jgi:hypothetical protein
MRIMARVAMVEVISHGYGSMKAGNVCANKEKNGQVKEKGNERFKRGAAPESMDGNSMTDGWNNRIRTPNRRSYVYGDQDLNAARAPKSYVQHEEWGEAASRRWAVPKTETSTSVTT